MATWSDLTNLTTVFVRPSLGRHGEWNGRHQTQQVEPNKGSQENHDKFDCDACPEARLAHDRCRRAGPVRIVELQPDRDVERETDRQPETQNRRAAPGPPATPRSRDVARQANGPFDHECEGERQHGQNDSRAVGHVANLPVKAETMM